MANYLILGCDEITELVVNPGENTLTQVVSILLNLQVRQPRGVLRLLKNLWK
jgi:hypothetical protein